MKNKLQQYHLVKRVQEQIQQKTGHIAFKEWAKTGEQGLTWKEVGEQISKIGRSLLASGVNVQQKVAIFAGNSIAWMLVDLAILHIRGVSVPIYATNTAEQAAFILSDSQVKILFVDGQEQLDAAIALKEYYPQLEKIIALDSSLDLGDCNIVITLDEFSQVEDHLQLAEWQKRINERETSDLFTLIYTSGTTGEPKGVMLDYANLASQFYLHDERLSVNEQDVSLSFLPLSHVFERAWSFYVMHSGGGNVFLRDTHQVREAMSAVKPTVMCAVPRFYEKIYSAINDKVAVAPWYRRALFNFAIRSGKKKFLSDHSGKRLNAVSSFAYRLADKLVLHKLRNILGGRVRFLPVAGAKLDDRVILFFLSIGINVKYGYGMTETCATVSCWEQNEYCLGSIGKPLPGIDIRISQDNEIQIRGPIIMRGYFNRDKETSEVFTEDGWFKTGDAGALDEKGNLFITERIKDLMKTSNGKYIAPQMIEGALGQDRFIDQIAIIADTHKFVTALIVPCFESLEEYAKTLNIKYLNRLELLRHSQIVEMFEQRLIELQKGLARFEQVKRFTLLPAPFSMEQGELTPTLKLRRKIILQKYHHEISLMYNE